MYLLAAHRPYNKCITYSQISFSIESIRRQFSLRCASHVSRHLTDCGQAYDIKIYAEITGRLCKKSPICQSLDIACDWTELNIWHGAITFATIHSLFTSDISGDNPDRHKKNNCTFLFGAFVFFIFTRRISTNPNIYVFSFVFGRIKNHYRPICT